MIKLYAFVGLSVCSVKFISLVVVISLVSSFLSFTPILSISFTSVIELMQPFYSINLDKAFGLLIFFVTIFAIFIITIE